MANTFLKVQVNADSKLENKYVRSTRFAVINGPSTSGTIALPPNSTVILDDFGGTVDAIVSQLQGGKPTFQDAVDGSSAVIATSFDSSGNYTLSGTPTVFPVGIIYRVQQKFIDFDSTSGDIINGIDVVVYNTVSTEEMVTNALIFG